MPGLQAVVYVSNLAMDFLRNLMQKLWKSGVWLVSAIFLDFCPQVVVLLLVNEALENIESSQLKHRAIILLMQDILGFFSITLLSGPLPCNTRQAKAENGTELVGPTCKI